MTIKEKVTTKEQSIRVMLDQLRSNLNNNRLHFNNNPQDWSYLVNLSHTETKLKEILEAFELPMTGA